MVIRLVTYKLLHLYYGAVGYADDVALVALSIYGMIQIYQIALQYAKQ